MKWKQRLAVLLLTAGGLLAMADAAKVAREASQPKAQPGVKPVWVSFR